MDRYAVYRDISPGYVVFDTLSDTVVALYPDRGDARARGPATERAATHRPRPRDCRDPRRAFVKYDQYAHNTRSFSQRWLCGGGGFRP